MAEPTTPTNTASSKHKRHAKRADAGNTAFERARATVQGLESNPVGVLVGGLAVGLIAGALIPRSERETRALSSVGKRIAEGATAALTAAKAAGKEQLSANMLTRDAAKEGVRKIFDSAISAAKDSHTA